MADEVETPEVLDETPVKITNFKEFNARVAEGIAEYLGHVPSTAMVAWFGPGGAPSYFRPLAPMPIDRYSIPIAIFQNDDVVRIYTLPALPPEMRSPPEPPEKDWVVRKPLRFTLTKTAPTYVTEEMDLTIMSSEIIDEWTQAATEMNSADAELEKVMALVEALEPEQPAGANLKEWLRKEELLEALEARDHREVDDETQEGEDETELEAPNGAGAPTVVPSAIEPSP